MSVATDADPARQDVAQLVAALRAVLDLCDRNERGDHRPWAVDITEIRSAIAAALGEPT